MQRPVFLLALVALSVALAGCNSQTPSGTGEDGQTPTDEDEITGGGSAPGPPVDEGGGSGGIAPGERESTPGSGESSA